MKELMTMIDKTGTIEVQGWTLNVVVTDVKKVFGTEKLLVELTHENLINGKRTAQWINRDSFKETV